MFITGLSPRRFDISAVRSNLKKLVCDQESSLEATSRGKLQRRKRFFFWRNLLTLGMQKRRLHRAILFTAYAFFYQMRCPLVPKQILLLMRKKSAVLEKVPAVKEVLRSYQELSLIQYRLVRKAQLACTRARKTKEVQLAKEGLKWGAKPILLLHAMGGTYLMRTKEYKPLAIFKPFDEEIGAPLNPSGDLFRGELGKRSVRSGLFVGEGIHREVAAYLVSKWLSLHVVPRTVYATFSDPVFGGVCAMGKKPQEKWGSFQSYVEGFHHFSKLNQEQRKALLETSVHALFLLDVIIGHLDRHFANILTKEKEILAVDNALSFPDRMVPFKAWFWQDLEQLKKPLHPSLVKRVLSLNGERLAKHLQKGAYLAYSELACMKRRIAALQDGVRAHLSCKEIITRYFSG